MVQGEAGERLVAHSNPPAKAQGSKGLQPLLQQQSQSSGEAQAKMYRAI